MKGKLAVIGICTLVLMADQASAQRRTTTPTHVRHRDPFRPIHRDRRTRYVASQSAIHGADLTARRSDQAIDCTARCRRVPRASVSIDDLLCNRKTTECFGCAAALRQPRRRFDFDPPLRFLLRDEARNMVTLTARPSNSDVPSRS
jgi:hypothetical protein